MKIALIGTGNVATHVAKRLIDLKFDIYGVLGSSAEKSIAFAEKFHLKSLSAYQQLAGADITIVCVQDNYLEAVMERALEFSNCATTSGTFDISGIRETNYKSGVFYPLQSFSADAPVDFSGIPFFIESADSSLEHQLVLLGEQLGKEAIVLSARDRINLHVTAVFLNNFTYHVSALGNEFAQSTGMEFSWFEALIDETFRKIKRGASFKDQTGPAQRGDSETIQKHLQLLDEIKVKVYTTLSESIQQKKQSND